MATNSTDHVITEAQATAWTAAWQTAQTQLPCAFIVDFSEIIDIQKEATPAAVQFRAYLGIDNSTATATFRLILVGVDANGNDITSATDRNGNPVPCFFDFNNPCPPLCDCNSVLMTVAKSQQRCTPG